MTRYFFDLQEDDALDPDDEGVECDGDGTVRSIAIRALTEVARDKLPDSDVRKLVIKARDESGRYVFEAAMTNSAGWVRVSPVL